MSLKGGAGGAQEREFNPKNPTPFFHKEETVSERFLIKKRKKPRPAARKI